MTRSYVRFIDAALILRDVFFMGHSRVAHTQYCFVTIATMDEVIGLFPTPVMRAPTTLGRPLVTELIGYFSALATGENNSSRNLTHTKMLQPGDSPLFIEAATLITPKLVDFGAQLFGERLGWSL